MTELPRPLETDSQGVSLQSLLSAIDRENATSLAQDAALAKKRASQHIRKKKPYICFMLGQDELALAIDSIQEIGTLPPVTPLPNLPAWIRGITQIRGEILSVIDFFVLFALPETTAPLHRSYILYRQPDFKFCLLADRITGVVNLDDQRDPLVPHLPGEAAHLARLTPYFKGQYLMDHRKVHLLDHEKLGTSPLIRKWQ